MERRVTIGRLVVDTSVYVDILRDPNFAAAFRPQYERAISRAHLSSIVAQELLAGARTRTQRRAVESFVEPFERTRRIITPTHPIWRDAGDVLASLWRDAPSYRSALGAGLVNDILLALTARAIGATVITRNRLHFEMIGAVRTVAVRVL